LVAGGPTGAALVGHAVGRPPPGKGPKNNAPGVTGGSP
jgi:hypothetical protein